jgi:alpha-glucosidase
MFLYQGEELGLMDGVVVDERAADPVGTRNTDHSDSRDGCRTPMPWSPGKGWGFTTAADPWLPFGGRTAADAAEVQRAADSSWVHAYRRLVAARHDLPPPDRAVEVLSAEPDDPVIAFRDGRVITVANVGDEPVELALPPGRWRVRYHAAGAENDGLLLRGALNLQSRDAYLLVDESDDTA